MKNTPPPVVRNRPLMHMTIDAKLKEALANEAKRLGISVSRLVEDACVRHLNFLEAEERATRRNFDRQSPQ
jgi:uncharacterized protein